MDHISDLAKSKMYAMLQFFYVSSALYYVSMQGSVESYRESANLTRQAGQFPCTMGHLALYAEMCEI